ncbi:MAG TPA: RNA methyltransferase, partial [Candidatus Limnocylindrales bacterium]|nr:RNA methyltransferase [Candidatus Limnocylindrales bacterium]
AVVTSLHNPRLRAAAALRERRARTREGRFLVDGTREIGRALDAGFAVLEAFVEPVAVAADPARAQLVEHLRAQGVAIVTVGPEALGKVAFGDRSEGIVAVVAAPHDIEDLEGLGAALPADPLMVVLEGLEKPGNVGAVLRSADGAGVSAVILADPVADPWNPNTIRASLGTVFSLPLRIGSSGAVRTWLADRGLRIVAARVDGATDYDAVDLTGPTAIVLGSEAQGLTDAWSGEGIEAVRLPMLGRADSLNVSATAAVLCYEASRQRRLSRSRPGRT